MALFAGSYWPLGFRTLSSQSFEVGFSIFGDSWIHSVIPEYCPVSDQTAVVTGLGHLGLMRGSIGIKPPTE